MAINPVGPLGGLSLQGRLGAPRGSVVPTAPASQAPNSDQVALSPSARALSKAAAVSGDDVPELKLSPAQLRAMVDAEASRRTRGDRGAATVPLKSPVSAGDRFTTREESHVG